MSKILVTGSEGGLGSSIVKDLISYGHDVIRVGRKKKVEINYFYGDLCNVKFVEDIFEIHEIDYVIHCAAHWNGYNKDFKIFYNNVVATLNVLKCCNNIKKFIYISSSAVYENSDRCLENCINNHPTSFYGISKGVSENMIKAQSLGNDFSFTIWRPFHIVCPNEQYRPGASHLCTNLYHQIVNEKKEIDIENFDDFKIIPLTWVKDISNIVVDCLNDERTDNNVFNIGISNGNTAKAIAAILINKINNLGLSSFSIKNYDIKKYDDLRFHKFKNILGVELLTDVDSCIDKFLLYKME